MVSRLIHILLVCLYNEDKLEPDTVVETIEALDAGIRELPQGVKGTEKEYRSHIVDRLVIAREIQKSLGLGEGSESEAKVLKNLRCWSESKPRLVESESRGQYALVHECQLKMVDPSREVVARRAKDLPDDTYIIDFIGASVSEGSVGA